MVKHITTVKNVTIPTTKSLIQHINNNDHLFVLRNPIMTAKREFFVISYVKMA